MGPHAKYCSDKCKREALGQKPTRAGNETNKIKVEKFGEDGLISRRDFHIKVLKHLQETNQAFCFTSIGIVSREDCEKFIEIPEPYCTDASCSKHSQ